jgi:hypothetical protein
MLTATANRPVPGDEEAAVDKKQVVAGAVGLTLLATMPKMTAPTKADPAVGQAEVVAAADMFLDLGPVKGESRDRRVHGRRSHTVPKPGA